MKRVYLELSTMGRVFDIEGNLIRLESLHNAYSPNGDCLGICSLENAIKMFGGNKNIGFTNFHR